jgi:hypothetical protein
MSQFDEKKAYAAQEEVFVSDPPSLTVSSNANGDSLTTGEKKSLSSL